jgi:hypothetical protein
MIEEKHAYIPAITFVDDPGPGSYVIKKARPDLVAIRP